MITVIYALHSSVVTNYTVFHALKYNSYKLKDNVYGFVLEQKEFPIQLKLSQHFITNVDQVMSEIRKDGKPKKNCKALLDSNVISYKNFLNIWKQNQIFFIGL